MILFVQDSILKTLIHKKLKSHSTFIMLHNYQKWYYNIKSFHVTISPAYTSHNRPVDGTWASLTMIVSSISKWCIIHKCK